MQITPRREAQECGRRRCSRTGAHYQHLSTSDLLKEQRRLMNSDPFGLSAQTSLRLSAINMLITQRQNMQTPQPVAPGLEPVGME